MLAFLGFLIVLLVMGPRSSAKEVFTHFENDSGWNSIGTACFVAINGPVITLLGSDSAVHLAEEMRDASRNLPRAMLSYAVVNYAIGFIMLLVFMFVVGDVQSVLATSTGEPWIQVIWNATESKGATTTMIAIVAFFFLFAAVNTNTTSPRQLYAFARDGGLPFSSWICKVSPQSDRGAHQIIRTPQQD
jgi:amino acid transporter